MVVGAYTRQIIAERKARLTGETKKIVEAREAQARAQAPAPVAPKTEIYYARDPQGKRVEVVVSKAEAAGIQAGGGWAKSGAQRHYEKQIATQAPLAVVSPEELRAMPPEKFREFYTKRGEAVVVPEFQHRVQYMAWAGQRGYDPAGAIKIYEAREAAKQAELATRREEFVAVPPPMKIIPEPPPVPPVHVTKEELAPTPFPIKEEIKYEPYTAFAPAGLPPEELLGMRYLQKILPPREEVKPYEFKFRLGEIVPGPSESPFARAERARVAKEEEARLLGYGEWTYKLLGKPLEFIQPARVYAPEGEVRRFDPGILLGLAAYSVAQIPATAAGLPSSVYALVTDPAGTITATFKQIITEPERAVPGLLGSLVVSWGLGGLIKTGLAKIRPRPITTATEVGVYRFDPVKGLGEVGIDITIKKGAKVIDTARAHIGFKAGKLFEPSPYFAGIVTKKGMYYALGRGYAVSKVTVPSGVSKTILEATGRLFKYPGFKEVLKVSGVYETLAGRTGLLRTIGLAAAKKGRGLYGQKLYSVLFRKPDVGLKITKIIPKPRAAPRFPPVVGAEVETIAAMITKEVTKPTPSAIIRTGVVTGAIAAFIGRGDVSTALRAPAREGAYPARVAGPPVMEIEGPWARRKLRPMIEEEEYISPMAARITGIQALDTRQRQATIQRLGMGTGQAQETISRLGVGQPSMEAIRLKPAIGVREKPMLAEMVSVAYKPALRMRVGVAAGLRFAVPAFAVPAPLPLLVEKKPLIKPSVPPELFHTFVKKKQLKVRKGKYRPLGYTRVSKQPMPREQALGLGASIVDKYTNRSFKIMPAKRARRKEGVVGLMYRQPITQGFGLKEVWARKKGKFRYKFRKGTTIPGVLVEKSQFAIDSPTEKQGIPYESMRLRKAGLLETRKRRKRLTKKRGKSFANIKELMGV